MYHEEAHISQYSREMTAGREGASSTETETSQVLVGQAASCEHLGECRSLRQV